MASNRVPFDRIQVSHFDPPITDDDRDKIICGICHDVLFDPVLTKCGHNFCCNCLTTYLKTKQTCPLDSLVLTYFYPDKKIERNIFNRTIVCSNECNWRGCYGKFSEHLSECLREKVPCTFGCGNIERKEQKQHEEVCERRIINCHHCVEKMRAFEMEKHKKECLFPIKCFKCEKVCLRKEMEDHLRDECPEEVVECSFVASGCKKKIKRREVLDHMMEATQDHLVSLQQQVLILMDKNKELTKRILQPEQERKREEEKQIIKWGVSQFNCKKCGTEFRAVRVSSELLRLVAESRLYSEVLEEVYDVVYVSVAEVERLAEEELAVVESEVVVGNVRLRLLEANENVAGVAGGERGERVINLVNEYRNRRLEGELREEREERRERLAEYVRALLSRRAILRK